MSNPNPTTEVVENRALVELQAEHGRTVRHLEHCLSMLQRYGSEVARYRALCDRAAQTLRHNWTPNQNLAGLLSELEEAARPLDVSTTTEGDQ